MAVPDIAPTLQAALDNWAEFAPLLVARYDALNQGGLEDTFDFDPQAHWDLGPMLGMVDFERAAKITGARFVVLKGLGSRLERSLIQFMLNLQLAFVGASATRKDGEDQLGAGDHPALEILLQVALLAGPELVVDDEVFELLHIVTKIDDTEVVTRITADVDEVFHLAAAVGVALIARQPSPENSVSTAGGRSSRNRSRG